MPREIMYSPFARQRLRQEKRDHEVLDRLYDILTANITDVVEHRRCNCRYCHGDNHEYQRKDWEMERDLNQYIARGKNEAYFNRMGGDGFDELDDPHPDCPNCFGNGISRVYVKDTRNVGKKLRHAIQSVRHTKTGTEIKFHDWTRAFMAYAQIRGLIIERKQISVTDLTQMPEEQLDAMLRQSSQLIDNDDPDFAPFIELLEDQRPKPDTLKPLKPLKPRIKRAVLFDE